MKRYFFIIVALLMLVASVQGYWALTFQQPSDFSQHVTSASCTWSHNITGGTSYVACPAFYEMFNKDPLPTQYAAWTAPGGQVNSQLLDSGGSLLWNPPGSVSCSPGPCREEMITSGTATWYQDGVSKYTSGALGQNPSYVGMGGSAGVDDAIWGDAAPRYIFGMPESGYFLMKDMINSGVSGFYRVNQTDPNGTPTLIYSGFFPSTFGKNSGTNETVTFSSPTGGTQLTYQTGTAYSGTIYWNLTKFFTQNPPYGFYQTTINPQLNSPGYAVSVWIPYIGNGASITWDRQSYTVGRTATLTTVISDSYYDASTYSYHLKIQDANFNTISDQPVTITTSGAHTGSVIYTFVSTNPNGIYYGEIYATKKSDNSEILMNYATSYMTTILTVDGYVFDAQNATIIAGAMVNVTQGSTTDTNLTDSNGFYTSVSSFTANAPTTIVASKSGYETYQTVFTPLSGAELQINLTLMPSPYPVFNGTALGGIARVSPYNRTVNNATIWIQNASAPGGNLTATTNAVGYYVVNWMQPNYVWNIWGSKTGFLNSTIVQKLVVGI